jgi:hypothetical protein
VSGGCRLGAAQGAKPRTAAPTRATHLLPGKACVKHLEAAGLVAQAAVKHAARHQPRRLCVDDQQLALRVVARAPCARAQQRRQRQQEAQVQRLVV